MYIILNTTLNSNMSRRNITALRELSQTSSYDGDRDTDYTSGAGVSSQSTYDTQSQSTVSNPPVPEDSSSSIETRTKPATQISRRNTIGSEESSESSEFEDSSEDYLSEYSDSLLDSLFGSDDSDYGLPDLMKAPREVLNLEDVILTSESSEPSQVSSHSSDFVVKYKENYSTSSDELTDYTSDTESVTLTNQSQSDISQSTGTSFEPTSPSSTKNSLSQSSVSSLSSSLSSQPPPSKRKAPIPVTQVPGRSLRSGKKLLIKRH